MLNKLVNKFNDLTPRNKQFLVLGSIVFIGCGILVVFSINDPPKLVQKKAEQEPYNYSILAVPKENMSTVTMEALQGQLASLNAEMGEQKRQFGELLQLYGKKNNIDIPPPDKFAGIKVPLPGINENGVMTGEVVDKTVSTPVDKLLAQQAQDFKVNQSKQPSGKPASNSSQPRILPPGIEQDADEVKVLGVGRSISLTNEVKEEPKQTFQIFMQHSRSSDSDNLVKANFKQPSAGDSVDPKGDSSNLPNVGKAADKPDEDTLYLPTGSIISGVLITGMDAPTSPQTRKEPFPALIRIKDDAILPNFYNLDLRECFLIASGYGDMSSERVMLRTETLSCKTNDGGVIESSIDGFASGDDGKTGIRSRLVSRNGQLIAQSLIAGFMGGLAQAFKPVPINSLNVSPTGTASFQTPTADQVLNSGAANGAYTAADKIAHYYMDLAKEITPVLELDAGRKVDFVIKKGVSLKVTSKKGSNFSSIADLRSSSR